MGWLLAEEEVELFKKIRHVAKTEVLKELSNLGCMLRQKKSKKEIDQIRVVGQQERFDFLCWKIKFY